MSRLITVSLFCLLGLSAASRLDREVYRSTAAVDENKEFEEVRTYEEKEDYKHDIVVAQKNQAAFQIQQEQEEREEAMQRQYLE